MAEEKLSNEKASFSVKYRAKCEDDNFSGPWRSRLEVAREDARNHRSKSGNRLHNVWILTRQEIGVSIDEEE